MGEFCLHLMHYIKYQAQPGIRKGLCASDSCVYMHDLCTNRAPLFLSVAWVLLKSESMKVTVINLTAALGNVSWRDWHYGIQMSDRTKQCSTLFSHSTFSKSGIWIYQDKKTEIVRQSVIWLNCHILLVWTHCPTPNGQWPIRILLKLCFIIIKTKSPLSPLYQLHQSGMTKNKVQHTNTVRVSIDTLRQLTSVCPL